MGDFDLDGSVFEMATVAKALGGPRKGWSTERTRRWLKRAGAARKVNGRWITTPEMLREQMAPIWNQIASKLLFLD